MDISVIICTYNPEERIFRRCLNAVQNFTRNKLNVEILLIDNNSKQALDTVSYIKDFLLTCENAKYIHEQNAGLTYARIAGFKNATAPILVFFDDDNEPEKDYLCVVNDILTNNENIGATGPGNITVDFIDGSNKWLETKRAFFQEIHLPQAVYASDLNRYHQFYPYGTGLVIRKAVMQKYFDIVIKNNEISDRSGTSLISGGDTQIVWCSIKMGYQSGRSPLLKLTHIVPLSRTTEQYIKKLHYFTSYSSIKSYLGVFPEKEIVLAEKKNSFVGFYFNLAKCIARNIFNKKKLQTELIPNLIGKASGYYFAFNKKKPSWLYKAEDIFKLKY